MADQYDINEFVLLGYMAFGGSIRGQTMLQKRMYFLSVMLGVDLGYGPHYYGPYSASVAAANADLKGLGYLNERSSPWGFDHRGFEMARCDYELSEAGQRVAERKSRVESDLWRRIENAASVINAAGDLDYMELSVAAKAYFGLTQLKGKATIDEIAALLPKFGWSVTKDDVSKATTFLQRANLVTQS